MSARLRLAGALVLLALLAACGGQPASGPADVTWDRDVCARCQMVISEHAFAAQVRGADGHVHLFDDPGCAALWLDEEPERAAPREIWVHELAGEAWLDAREASFVRVENTPMGYGLGAQRARAPETLDFAQLRRAVRKQEDERRSRGR